MWKNLLLTLLSLLLFALFFLFTAAEEPLSPFSPEEDSLFVPLLPPPSLILRDPEMAPLEIREQVMLGFHILNQTQEYGQPYVGNKLNCRNCHFESGNTSGGINGSISLVGVSYAYPRYSERDKRTISLEERVQRCFQRSLNGTPPPIDSPFMKAIIAYLKWISLPAKNEKLFWLGLPDMRGDYQPSASNGARLYKEHCALCHGAKGEGTRIKQMNTLLDIPPLWGKDSFNDGAGMMRVDVMAPFIHLNMPYGSPFLTDKEAVDIAQYIISQPRPHYDPLLR